MQISGHEQLDSTDSDASGENLIRRRSQFPVRGFLVAFSLAPLHAAWLTYGEIVLGVATSSASILPSVLTALFLLTFLNAGLGRLRPSWKLTSADLMVCYAVLTLSGVLTGFDFLQLLPHSLMFPAYFRQVSPTFGPMADALPSWFRPTDPAVVQSFFEGRVSPLDPALWRAWLLPLTVWTGFVMTLLLTLLCANLLVRDQWFRQERLPFPIVELPLTLCAEHPRERLYQSRLFQGAFAATFILLSSNALSALLPVLPHVQLSLNNIGREFAPPLSGAAPLYLSWQPFVIGLLFFVPLDVLFSSWFFFLVRKGLEVTGVVYGWREPYAGTSFGQFPYVREVAQGAWIGLFLLLLWGGWRHFVKAFRNAFPPRGTPPNPVFRAAFLGLAGGWAALALFEWAAGMRLWLALTYFGLFFLSSLVMTRVFAQVGAPVLELYFFNTENLLLSFIGTRALRGPEVSLLAQCYWFNHAYRQHPMGHQLAALKMAEEGGLRQSTMVTALVGAMLVGTVVGLTVMIGSYHALGATSAQVNSAQLGVGGWETWNRALSWEAGNKGPQAIPLLTMASGFLLCIGLGHLGNIWLSSPFRPVGLAFAFSYALDYFWNVFLLVWLIKLVVLRYGGLRYYRQLAPLFLGMAMGDAMTQVAWGIVSAGTGVRDISVHLPPRF